MTGTMRATARSTGDAVIAGSSVPTGTDLRIMNPQAHRLTCGNVAGGRTVVALSGCPNELYGRVWWAEAEEMVRAQLAAVTPDTDVPASVVRCWWMFLRPDAAHRAPDAQAAATALPGGGPRVAGAASLTPARATAQERVR